MSLIDDALKRAREQGRTAGDPSDAARTESERAASDPWAYAPLPERQGRSALVIGGVVGVLALAGIVAVLALRREGAPAPKGTSPANASPRAAVSGSDASTTPRNTTPLATVFVPPPPRGLGRAAAAATPRATVAPDVGVPRAGALPSPSPIPAAAVPPPPAATVSTVRAAAAPAAPLPTALPARAAASLPEISASGSPRIANANEPSRTTVATGTGTRPPVRQEPLSGAPAPASSSVRPDSAPASGPPPGSRSHAAAPSGPARTYVGSFSAPSGAKIDLGGIVFSTTPVALLNGRVVPVGGVVEGLTVVSIEENRVELSGEGVHILLSLK